MTRFTRAAVIAVVAALAFAASCLPASAGWDWTRPGGDQTTASVIHPYWDQARWRDFPGQSTPILCVDNHSSFALQTATEQWDAGMVPDGKVYYQTGNDCDTFYENETIDVFNGSSEFGPCIWRSITYSGNYYANMNVYINTHPNVQSSCAYSSIAVNHRASTSIGIGLGAQEFNKNFDDQPDGTHVMDRAGRGAVSWAQRPTDGANWRWRY